MTDPDLTTQIATLSPADRAAALDAARTALLVMLDNNQEQTPVESFKQADTPTKFARVVEEIRPGAKFTLLRGTDAAQFVATWDDDTRIVTEHWAIRGLNHSQMLHYLRPHVSAANAGV